MTTHITATRNEWLAARLELLESSAAEVCPTEPPIATVFGTLLTAKSAAIRFHRCLASGDVRRRIMPRGCASRWPMDERTPVQ